MEEATKIESPAVDQPTVVEEGAKAAAKASPPKAAKSPPKSGKAATAKKASASKKATAKIAKPAAPLWTFPKNTLEDAIKIARAIEEQNGGNPMKPDMLSKAVGFNSLADWRFLDLLRSANQYGLVDNSGKINPVGLTPIGQDVVAPSAPSDRPKALREAFRSVEDFRKVEDFYKGKKLPEDEFFENNLFREFSIPRERVKAFIETFTSNLNYLHAFRPDKAGVGPVIDSDLRPSEPDIPGGEDGSAGRQFLDTCFVMMPFGQWMDAYYREIYVPAIREAGLGDVDKFEPVSCGGEMDHAEETVGQLVVS
ncbi:hypothetical protein VF10_38670, partial [Nostoc linckia z13]|uniref:hypothetical protein n=1 Tax=Nostoc linckia TaxID=92942 RepID=UPI000C0246E1